MCFVTCWLYAQIESASYDSTTVELDESCSRKPATSANSNYLTFPGSIELKDIPHAVECAITLELVYKIKIPVIFEHGAGKQGKLLSRVLAQQQSIAAIPRQTEEAFVLRFGYIHPFHTLVENGTVQKFNVLLEGMSQFHFVFAFGIFSAYFNF